MTHTELRRKFTDFFKARGHVSVPSAPLVPENDPTTLFTGSGMQPLVPYLLGEEHPLGKRIVDIQKCFRAEDLDEVGVTPVHHTFFEMMGNWSLGDYFKKEQIPWALEFFVKELSLDINRIYVTVFEGEGAIPKDTESIELWKKEFLRYGVEALEGDKYQVGKEGLRIFAYGREKNWWERSAAPPGDPGGPSSEMFYDTGKKHDPAFGEFCHVNCDCRKFVEICNNVFMEYQKQKDGSYKPLKNKNVDVGYGLERIMAVISSKDNTYQTDLFTPIVSKIEELSGKTLGADLECDRDIRMIADHMRASVFLIADGVLPSNKEQGYVLRRLIRRTIRFASRLGIRNGFTGELAEVIIIHYQEAYPYLEDRGPDVIKELLLEEDKFSRALQVGLKKLEHVLAFSGVNEGKLSGEEAFMIYETYGFPLELIQEVAREVGVEVDLAEFDKASRAHREKSKTESDGKFKGGLEDTGEIHLKYHTATHLLHKALRDVLGETVRQMGSNITAERLRFDFSYDKKLTPEQIKAVEELINLKISEGLPVSYSDLLKDEAEKTGALHFFGEKYGDVVRIYYIGKDLESAYSKEYCGGPHAESTKGLGTFKIVKEEAVSSGVRRIKAVLL